MRTTVLLAILAIPFSLQGQEKTESGGVQGSVFKVDFTIRDGSDAAGKVARHYSMLLDGTGRGSFRIGHKVPYTTGSFQQAQAGGGPAPVVSTQWNYLDAGVNIDSRVREVNGKLLLHAEIEVSSVVRGDAGGSPTPPTPTVTQSRLTLDSVVITGKPTLIASVDDPATMRKFDVEVVVTKQN